MKSVFVVILAMVTLFSKNIFAESCGTSNIRNTNPQQKSTVMTDEQGTFRLWKNEQRQKLTYCISPRFKELKPTIERALQMATSDWMSYGNIRFEYIPEADQNCDHRKGPSTLFRIAINTSRRYPYAGRAFFPYDERNTITFKKTYVEGSFDELLRLTRHELGHVLGLRHEHIRHENPYRENCKEPDTFADITEYDRDSIMHYARCGGSGGLELSEGDKEGIALLYPKTKE